MNRERIRLGVVGAGRGRSFAEVAGETGFDLTAVCDKNGGKLDTFRDAAVATYTDFDSFLEHPMDAVVLANYLPDHARFAIRALEAGVHVMSECTACATVGEGVELIDAVEKSGLIYMFAENYPYMRFNQEMRRLYLEGTVGELKYGEGEYLHPDPAEERTRRSVGIDHWRNWLPATYYCTHSLAPLMYITGTRPAKVNGFVVPYDYDDPSQTRHVRRSDTAGMIVLRMNNGALVKLLQGNLRGHQIFVRIHGNRGLMENCRTGDCDMVRLRREPFEKPQGTPVETIYLPDFPFEGDRAVYHGHRGGDFYTSYHFNEAIRSGKNPTLDVYSAVEMSIVGILAYKSALADSESVAIPDLRVRSDRDRHRKDDWSPDPARRRPGQPSASIRGEIEPTDEAIEFSRTVWETER